MKNKPKKIIALLCVALTISLFTGCESSDIDIGKSEISTIEKSPIKTVRDTFGEEIISLKSEKFDNISFEDLNTYSFPDIDTLTAYRITRSEDGNGLAPEQFFENFVKYCDYFAPGKFTKEEIAEKVIIQGDFHMDDDRDANYNEFKEINKDGGHIIGYAQLETPEIYLGYFGDGPYWYIGDNLKKHYNISEGSPMRVDIFSEEHHIVYYTENIESEKTYPLADGEISIADAAKKANALFAEISALCGDNMLERVVCGVCVVEMGGGKYGYYFTTTPIIDGVKYAFSDMRSGDGGAHSFSEESLGSGSWDHAYMIESDKICSFTNASAWKEKTPIETYDSIVTLKTAVKNASVMLSGHMRYKAKSVTLVYDIKGIEDELVPCWRFVLENSADRQQYYHVYVNAITGEARVKAIQEVKSGYEYD